MQGRERTKDTGRFGGELMQGQISGNSTMRGRHRLFEDQDHTVSFGEGSVGKAQAIRRQTWLQASITCFRSIASQDRPLEVILIARLNDRLKISDKGRVRLAYYSLGGMLKRHGGVWRRCKTSSLL